MTIADLTPHLRKIEEALTSLKNKIEALDLRLKRIEEKLESQASLLKPKFRGTTIAVNCLQPDGEGPAAWGNLIKNPRMRPIENIATTTESSEVGLLRALHNALMQLSMIPVPSEGIMIVTNREWLAKLIHEGPDGTEPDQADKLVTSIGYHMEELGTPVISRYDPTDATLDELSCEIARSLVEMKVMKEKQCSQSQAPELSPQMHLHKSDPAKQDPGSPSSLPPKTPTESDDTTSE